MKIALVDVDGHNKFPNLALMKISTWHKAQGDSVEWYSPLFSKPDKIYASKVFSFTPDYIDYAPGDPEPQKGGTGYDIAGKLPVKMEQMRPDYTLYPDFPAALGFLTRGCVRSCPWCVVPEKEGALRVVDSIGNIAAAACRNVVLLDNNFLAAPPDFVRQQLTEAARMGLRLDFNQGLDARLVTPEYARLLAGCRWIRFIRFSCDTAAMIEPIRRAVRLIRETGSRREIFCYMLVQDIADAETRLRALVELGVTPFAQPFRDISTSLEPPEEQQLFARFANIKGGKLCRKMAFKDYRRM